MTLDDKVLLDARTDGFMSVKEIRISPRGDRFAVIACGYECNDNIGFVFRADGGGKLKITGRWDYILKSSVEWSEDGRKLYYFRISSTGAEAPPSAPAEGWVEVDVRTGRKSPARTRRLKLNASYSVINVRGGDVLNIRSAPGSKSPIGGAIPPDGWGITVTGPGVKAGRERWVPIRFGKTTGWVNQNYLCEEAESLDALRQSPK